MIGDHLRTFVRVQHPVFELPSGHRVTGWQVGDWNGFPIVALDAVQYRALQAHLGEYEGTPNAALAGVWNCDGLQWERRSFDRGYPVDALPMPGRGWAYSEEGGLPCQHCGGLAYIDGVWLHADTRERACPEGTEWRGWRAARDAAAAAL